MRLLVCGGREFTDYALVDLVLTRLAPTEIAHGFARGADTLADDWALIHGIPAVRFPVTNADWERYGKRAGHLRNGTMLDTFQPDAVVAFPGGRGTADMVSKATWARVRVLQASQYNCVPHNWIEDFLHENGNYIGRCFKCGQQFLGHKRRPSCRTCAYAA